jgi:hypothetical protein
MGFGDQGQEVAGEVHPAPLVGGALEGPADRGDQAGVLVGDHQAHPGQAALPAAHIEEQAPMAHTTTSPSAGRSSK